MSREQWGHGYWSGVEAAESGRIRTSYPTEAKIWACLMCLFNCDKPHDKSLFSVRDFRMLVHFSGLDDVYAKRIYDIAYNKGIKVGKRKCYVVGSESGSWEDDYFELPIDEYPTKRKWQSIISKYLDRSVN